MSYHTNLELALQAVSKGTAALQHMMSAVKAVPHMTLPDDFVRRAMTVPLKAVADLMVETPSKRTRRAPRKTRKRRVSEVRELKPNRLPDAIDLGEFAELASSWDPSEEDIQELFSRDASLEASNCRALLLEIIRRASYDWVLYRSSSKLPNRMLAENAHHWLFVEENSGPTWEQRQRGGKELTSFETICEVLDLDPDRVRVVVRRMTERDIMGAGRPAERRRAKSAADEVMQSEDLRVFDVDVDALPQYDPMFAVSEG